MAELIKVVTEYAPEYEQCFVFGYFDSEPAPEEGARAYFEEYLHRALPDEWHEWPECSASRDAFTVAPALTDGVWRVLLGDHG
jgi:nitroimidazol reductase NimA-like FMN-containing flavoprotein (pyridoxamine 5'-phosphate oxidase superfamily)